MYQPYPSTDRPVEPDQPPAPQSVLNAVKLMYAGAAVSAVSLIISLATISGTKDAIKPSLTATQVNQLNTFIIALAVVSGVIGVALWLWMARKNGQGKSWARILSTVLFALATVDLFGVVSQPKTVLGLVFPVLTWLIGLGAVVFLWRRESTEFFKPQRLV
jgi:hypothetical protein